MKRLTPDIVILTNKHINQIYDNESNIINLDNLLSALSIYDNNYYNTYEQVASAVFRNLITAHAFSDGNKRTATICLLYTLKPKCDKNTIAELARKIAIDTNLSIDYISHTLYNFNSAIKENYNNRRKNKMSNTINLREELNRIDKETDNKYDLRNLYDSLNITVDIKKKLTEAIMNGTKPKKIYEGLYDLFKNNDKNIDNINFNDFKDKTPETKIGFKLMNDDKSWISDDNIFIIRQEGFLDKYKVYKYDGESDEEEDTYDKLPLTPTFKTVDGAKNWINNNFYKDGKLIKEDWEDEYDDWELSGIYGGDLTYCPICGRRLQHDEYGDAFCPKCQESVWSLSEKRRKLDKERKKQEEEDRKARMNNGMYESYQDYKKFDNWEQEDIDTYNNTDWEERNYKELPIPDDNFMYDAILYDEQGKHIERVNFIKFIRPNPIFPPYYAPDNKPFEHSVGPMYDGESRGKYDIHNRYESQGVYDTLSEGFDKDSELITSNSTGNLYKLYDNEYVAYNKSDVWLGDITADNDSQAVSKFNKKQFNEAINKTCPKCGNELDKYDYCYNKDCDASNHYFDDKENVDESFIHYDEKGQFKPLATADSLKVNDLVYDDTNGHTLKVTNIDKSKGCEIKLDFLDLDTQVNPVMRVGKNSLFELADENDSVEEIDDEENKEFWDNVEWHSPEDYFDDINESMDNVSIDEIETFINKAKDKFNVIDSHYDGDKHTIEIQLADIENTPIEDIEQFIDDAKNTFNTTSAYYDGDNNSINITLDENSFGKSERAIKRYLSKNESLNEDTVKQNGKWVNKGKEGTHGKFRTKKEADAQRKAMFARGFKESADDKYDTDFDVNTYYVTLYAEDATSGPEEGGWVSYGMEAVKSIKCNSYDEAVKLAQKYNDGDYVKYQGDNFTRYLDSDGEEYIVSIETPDERGYFHSPAKTWEESELGYESPSPKFDNNGNVIKECINEGAITGNIRNITNDQLLNWEKELYLQLDKNKIYPENVSLTKNKLTDLKLIIDISGDWKHDHLATEDIIEEFCQNHNWIIVKHSQQEIGESDSDYYEAEHTWDIEFDEDGKTNEVVNSLRKMFAPINEDVKTDTKATTLDFTSESGTIIANNYKEAEEIYNELKKHYMKVKYRKYGSKWHLDYSKPQMFENLQESYSDEVLEEIMDLTNNFEKESGTITAYNKKDKDICVKQLKHHYNIVEVSDGRMSNDEKMSYVIAYDEKK